MKILWIEDFGGKLAASKIAAEVFKGLLATVNLGPALKPGKTNIASQLSELFEQHSLHEIFVCRSYVEWKKTYEEQDGDFDIALIDINLEASPTPIDAMPEGIENRQFDRRAGFHIYHKLIRQGFPDDNIAFFTGEGQSLDEFTNYCGEIFLDRPKHCFEKDPHYFEQLRQWLAAKAGQESLVLRRGIIEGCRFLKKTIKCTDQSALESRLLFYKTTARNVASDPEMFRREAIDYLAGLERFFLPHQTYDAAHSPFLFIRELAAKWEASSGAFIRGKDMPRFETRLEERFHSTAQFQMKLLRNWSEHNLLSADLRAKDIAYFFMLAMRSWVASDLRQVLRYERILSCILTEGANKELGRQVNSHRLEYDLEQSYARLNTLVVEMKKHFNEPVEIRRHDNYFLEKFKGVGDLVEMIRRDEYLRPTLYEFYRRKVREQSVRLLYESYWHGLFPLYLGKPLYANLQSVGFNIEPLPESFLSFLGQSIMSDCFREEDREVNVA
jgi:hypothetical protein